MATPELPDYLRTQVKKAVTHYARFYAELVGQNITQAEQELRSITEIDRVIKASEELDSFNTYFERRTQLMRIFHFQLMKTIEGQVQQELLDEAEKLIDRLEILPG